MAETVQQLLRERAEDDNPGGPVRRARPGRGASTSPSRRAVAAALIGARRRRPGRCTSPPCWGTPRHAADDGRGRAGRLHAVRDQQHPPRRGPAQGHPPRRVPAAGHRRRAPAPARRAWTSTASGCSTPRPTSGPTCSAGAGALTPYREVEAMDTFMMIFTSGTSGDPKAVQVNHLMVLFSGPQPAGPVRARPRRRLLRRDAALPLQRRGRGLEPGRVRRCRRSCRRSSARPASSTTSASTA